jgi:Tfp pilus assembly protein PilN
VNLARRPFANIRPLRRVAVLLWLVGAGLFALAGVLYWRSLFGIEGGQDRIAAMDRSIEDERRRLAAADAALAAMDLRRQNVEATYLDARIRERTFPWSGLFEHIAEVLPRHVRIESLAPAVGDSRAIAAARNRRPVSFASAGRVYLQLRGVAADDEALTTLIDHLFASPFFEHPSLPQEAHRQGGGIDFALNVVYLPSGLGKGSVKAPPAPTPRLVEAAPSPRPSPGGAP